MILNIRAAVTLISQTSPHTVCVCSIEGVKGGRKYEPGADIDVLHRDLTDFYLLIVYTRGSSKADFAISEKLTRGVSSLILIFRSPPMYSVSARYILFYGGALSCAPSYCLAACRSALRIKNVRARNDFSLSLCLSRTLFLSFKLKGPRVYTPERGFSAVGHGEGRKDSKSDLPSGKML